MRIATLAMILVMLGGCSGDGSGPDGTVIDQTPTTTPTALPENMRAALRISSPANNRVVFLPFDVTFEILNTEARGIAIFIDGQQLRVHTAEDVQGSFSLDNIAEGVHEFRFELRDAAGNPLPDPFSKVTIKDVTVRTHGSGGGGMG